MEQEQTIICPEHGVQQITGLSRKDKHIVNREPLAYSVLARLLCGHSVRVAMSVKNMSVLETIDSK